MENLYGVLLLHFLFQTLLPWHTMQRSRASHLIVGERPGAVS
jgi:hypothetical protein